MLWKNLRSFGVFGWLAFKDRIDFVLLKPMLKARSWDSPAARGPMARLVLDFLREISFRLFGFAREFVIAKGTRFVVLGTEESSMRRARSDGDRF